MSKEVEYVKSACCVLFVTDNCGTMFAEKNNNGINVDTTSVIEINGNTEKTVCEYVSDRHFFAYQHWVKMYNNELLDFETFMLILKDPSCNIFRFYNAKDIKTKTERDKDIKDDVEKKEALSKARIEKALSVFQQKMGDSL